MHIAVNAHLLSPVGGYRQAGVSGYIQQILRHMLRIDAKTRWTIYAAPGTTQQLVDAPEHNVRWRVSRLPTNSPPARIFWEQFAAPGHTLIDRPDVLFCPLNVVPLAATCPTVVTIHDLAFLRFKLHRASKRNYLAAMTRLSARRAGHIITVSEFTRGEVIELLGVHPAKVTAIPNGKDDRLAPVDPAAAQSLRAAKGLPPQYLLFVGTLEPRKNVVGLLRAYAAVKDVVRMPLLIVGGKGWWFDEIFKMVKQLHIEDKVKFLGFVPTDDLTLYYGTATALVYPSFYEGFGLPPLEAMAAGLPVVTSNVGAIKEVVGDAAVTVDVRCDQALSEALVRVTGDEVLRNKARLNGLARAALFSWHRAAEVAFSVLKSQYRTLTKLP